MNIKIHRGQNQIGGNIVEISSKCTRILLDVGLDLNEKNNEKLPDIPGLFDDKGYDAVLISHYHSDHIGLAYFINKEIPLYMGEESFKIIKASDNYKRAETLSPKGFLKHKIPIFIGDITITPFLCDHSAYDSYMLLCESYGQRVLYTGDFRSNGRKSYSRLLNELPSKIDKLICEGTTLSRKGYVNETERSLEEKAVKMFEKTQGPIFILQSSMNIDRIVTMYRAAKRNNRIFLQDLYMAEITSSIGNSIPSPAFDDVFAFITNSSRYEGLCKHKNKVGKDFIKKSNFVMCVRTSMLKYLQGLAKLMSFDDGLLVYSFWSGYKETEEMQYFMRSLKDLGLNIVTLHTSGHGNEKAIKELIARVNPGEIIPIHTENPEWFKNRNNF